MGSHPLNLAIRFILELCALASVGTWGWNQSESWLRIVLALGIPVSLAAVWGIFAVPGDPSRSGNSPVVTPGIVRLAIELVIFGFATWSLFDMDYNILCISFGVIAIVHYLISFDRIMWLLSK